MIVSMNLAMKNIEKQFDGLKVLDGVSMDFKQNRVTCILGPSGCGKTTLLNIAASIVKPDNGSVVGFDSQPLSFIFQEDRLIEWRTVEENVSFVLKDQRDKSRRQDLIDRYLKLVGLYEFRKYYPNKLSGGMRQRVSIARAFAFSSRVLIMDEPFKSLDLNIKMELMKCLDTLIREEPKTILFVTHDIEEAVILGDEIVILTEKPTKIKKILENNLPRQDRWNRNQSMDMLKDEIVRMIFASERVDTGI